MRVRKILGVAFFILLAGGIFWALMNGDALLGYINNIPQIRKASPTPGATVQEVAGTEKPATEETPSNSQTITATVETTVNTQTVENEIDTVVILIADQIDTLEPYHMIDRHPDASVAVHIWDRLAYLNNDLMLEPQVAESWRLVNNFTWEFKLRQGITFHNGEILDAEAVRFSIERAQSLPNSVKVFATDINLKNIEIIDDFTIRISTDQPIANLPYYFASLDLLPPGYYSETSPEQLAVAPIGSGPYKLSAATNDERFVLEAIPDYWLGTPVVSQIVFQTVPSLEDRLTTLANEELALATDLPPIAAAAWDVPGSNLVAIEGTQRLFIGINIQPGSPFEKQEVRQALNYAVNVEQIIADWFEGYGTPYGSWVNPPYNNPDLAPWAYDPEQARKLLIQAGYGNGFTTTLALPTGLYYQDVAIAESVAAQLEAVGIKVSLEKFEWPVYFRYLLSDNRPPLFLLGMNSHGQGLEDVKNISTHFAFNLTNWQNDFFEAAVKRAMNTFDDSARARHLNRAQAIAYDEAPWIWLWRPYDFYGVTENFDWQPRRDGLINLYQAATTSVKTNE